MERYFDFIHFIAYKHNIEVQKLIDDFNEFVKEEATKLKKSGIEDDYKNFIDKQEDKLNEQFSREHSFQTSVRGLKLREYSLIKMRLRKNVRSYAKMTPVTIFL